MCVGWDEQKMDGSGCYESIDSSDSEAVELRERTKFACSAVKQSKNMTLTFSRIVLAWLLRKSAKRAFILSASVLTDGLRRPKERTRNTTSKTEGVTVQPSTNRLSLIFLCLVTDKVLLKKAIFFSAQ